MSSWGIAVRQVNPPRVMLTRLARGATVGAPHDYAQQRRVLLGTLALLAWDAPLPMTHLDEEAPAIP